MIMDTKNVKVAFSPVDLNTAAITGARISLEGARACLVLLNLGTSLTGAAVQVTLRQHNASSSGTSKDLVIDRPYFHKAAPATVFTKVVPGSAAALKDVSAIFDTAAGLVAIEVREEDLDHNNGFTYFSVDLADGAVAKIGSGIYVLDENEFHPSYSISI